MGQDQRGYFLYEPEKFSPPIKDMIASYEGFPATPFLANDMTGIERYLGDYKGKVCLLMFLDLENPECERHFENFNRIKGFYPEKKLELVSFVDQDRATATTLLQSQLLDFTVIPNGRLFGEAAYSIELGYPRIFVIDRDGVIQKVLPAEAFAGTEDSFEMVRQVVETID